MLENFMGKYHLGGTIRYRPTIILNGYSIKQVVKI
jgi:hypothetical protein